MTGKDVFQFHHDGGCRGTALDDGGLNTAWRWTQRLSQNLLHTVPAAQ